MRGLANGFGSRRGSGRCTLCAEQPRQCKSFGVRLRSHNLVGREMSSGSVSDESSPLAGEPTLARRLGPFDATMIVMGGIIGAGIFVNPSVVARQVHTPALALGAWVIGGLIALVGAFVYAELAVLRPGMGGQYAYLRDAHQ